MVGVNSFLFGVVDDHLGLDVVVSVQLMLRSR